MILSSLCERLFLPSSPCLGPWVCTCKGVSRQETCEGWDLVWLSLPHHGPISPRVGVPLGVVPDSETAQSYFISWRGEFQKQDTLRFLWSFLVIGTRKERVNTNDHRGLMSLQKISVDQNLSIRVQSNTVGDYYCHAQIPEFPPITSRAAEVLMNGPPRILSPETQYAIPGEDAHLNCASSSVPEPTRVEWSFHDAVLDESKRVSSFLTSGFRLVVLIFPPE